MLGNAQRIFIEKCAKNPWKIHSHYHEQPQWPLLEKFLTLQCLGYVDYALAQKLMYKVGQTDECVAALICHLSMAVRQGHLCVIIDDIVEPNVENVWILNNSQPINAPISHLFNELTHLIIEGAEKASNLLIRDVFEKIGSTGPICKWNQHYYLQRYWELESSFLRYFQPLLSSLPKIYIDDNEVQKALACYRLQPEQAKAVLQACKQAFTMITGGPGTGKTYTAGILLRIFWESLTAEQKKSCRIALAAPTGKAAANLEKSINQALQGVQEFPQFKATTLHALLGKQRINESIVIDANLILIDESSMIDIALMGRLMSALKPGVRLIMLGDKYQLPSVEAGSLFADMVDYLQAIPDCFCVNELKTCLRAELKGIIELSEKVKQGNEQEVLEFLSRDELGITHIPINESLSIKEMQTKLVSYGMKNFPAASSLPKNPLNLLIEFSRFRILTPMRQGPFGVDALNVLFYNEFCSRTKHAEYLVIPIIIVSNDRQRELFNGEVGLLIKYREYSFQKDFSLFAGRGSEPTVRKIPAVLLPKYEYAYCLSVHKSQGSEFDHVVMLLSEGAHLFGREALYTGITRVRRALEIWSSPKELTKMLANVGYRHSGIKARLAFQ